MSIIYKRDLEGVDWVEMKAILEADDFDNGRIVGTARLLSDGVCNAYVVDVWTYSPLRRQGIGRTMTEALTAELPGQHVYLFTGEDTVGFYRELGFEEQGIGLGRVIGRWLDNSSQIEGE